MKVKVVSNTEIANGIYSLRVKADNEVARACLPGQFAHISVPGSDSRLLRRPISINTVDTGRMEVGFIYKSIGNGTQRLAAVNAGDELDMLLPLGNGYKLASVHKKVWLVGGGIGCAPLMMMAENRGREYKAFLGFGTAREIFEKTEFELFCKDVKICTDDGTAGEHCFVTQLVAEALKTEKPDMILACGPKPMLAALKKAAPDVPIQVSLEQHMGCGTGGCYTCTELINGSMKRVCTDGPVFDIAEVNFDD